MPDAFPAQQHIHSLRLCGCATAKCGIPDDKQCKLVKLMKLLSLLCEQKLIKLLSSLCEQVKLIKITIIIMWTGEAH